MTGIIADTERPLLWAVIGSLIVNVVGALVIFILPGTDDVPGAAKVASVVFAALALLGAYGLMKHMRWGWWVTLIVTVINVLSSIPGIFDWPSTSVGVAIIVGVVLGIGVVVLLLRHDVRDRLT